MNAVEQFAQVNIRKKQKQELSKDYWLYIEKKMRERDNDKDKEEEVIKPKESNGAKFKKRMGISKNQYRLLLKHDLTENMLDSYRDIRKKRKQARRKIQKKNLSDNQLWRRSHPRKKMKGKPGKNKGKKNKQDLEVKKEPIKT